MVLHGSCQCGKVRFRVRSETPYPFMYCYCSICRKTAGGPFGCNIMGVRDTLRVTGRKHLRVYHAVIREKGKRAVRSSAERWFCRECGSHLYLLDDRWPEGVWPNAAAIDTPLPVPPENVHLMLRYKPAWVRVSAPGPRHPVYPELSIAEWHAKHRLSATRARGRKRV
ncbi:MAG: GFA family protein [Candidatus Binatia bacterium]